MSFPNGDRTAARVAILPDSFKGSATAAEVAQAMADGVRSAGAAMGVPVQIETLPFADGGEGTLDAICSAWGVAPRTVDVTDALGRPTTGRCAVSVDGVTGVVEAAEANGITLVSDVPFQPLHASTRGVADLVRSLLDEGCEEILLCIGGSATTDGGAGLLQGLGARFLDRSGRELPPGGAALHDLASIDLDGLDQRAREVRWRIACDVTNPLVGVRGAAAVFGPQKGADAADVRQLDDALTVLADVLHATTGADVRALPGAGAAGGMPATLVALLDAEILPGGVLVADLLRAQDLLTQADVVLTGEGTLDSQSLGGKVVDTVRRLTPAATPVLVIAGAVDLAAADLDAAGITAAFSIARGPRTLAELRLTAAADIAAAAEQVMRVQLGAMRTQLPPAPLDPTVLTPA